MYAATGGKISGVPATEWLGIKFSDQYVEYKQIVENQVLAYEKTAVELTSTLCDEGLVILEFDLKLSKEDHENLSKSSSTEKYIQEQEEKKTRIREEVIDEIKMEKYNEEWAKGKDRTKYEDIVVTEEEINARCEDEIAKINRDIEVRKKTTCNPALSLNYRQKGGTYYYDKFNPNSTWYASIYIDDTPYYVRNWQDVEKISDYEYKIYTIYVLSDDVVKGKENFKVTLKNNKLVNMINWGTTTIKWRNDCQWFADDSNSEMEIELPGEFEVNVSKNVILRDSTVIENANIKSQFRNITHTVEKVVISPIQTIIRINHSATQQSSNAYGNRYTNPNIEHLPITRRYEAYDSEGKELSCFSASNKNTLIYSNGTREDYDHHDIPNKKYSNATWETINYLLIENTDTDYIKIVPIEQLHNPVKGPDGENITEYEMEPIIIDMTLNR